LAAADGGWIIGLLLVILALMLICDAARMAFRSPAFLETAKTSDGQTELT